MAGVGKIIRVDESVNLVIGLVTLGGVDAGENEILVEKDAAELVICSPLPGALRICGDNLSPILHCGKSEPQEKVVVRNIPGERFYCCRCGRQLPFNCDL